MAEQHRRESTPAGRDIPPGHAVGSETLIGSAIDELHKQHPHTQIAHHDDRGPYHYTSEHERHIPVVHDVNGRAKRPYSK
jgi:hypothetical protein